MMVYKKNIMEGLRDMASKEFQLIAWFENDQGLCSSYADDDAAVFEGTGLQEALDAGEVVFGKDADAALRDLDKAIRAIGYDRDERELVHSPEMQVIRDKAAGALALIEASDGRGCTVEIVE